MALWVGGLDVGWGQGNLAEGFNCSSVIFRAESPNSKPISNFLTTLNPELNQVLSNYQIVSFIQARPEAKTQKVKDLYEIKLQNQNRIVDLYNELKAVNGIKEVIKVCEYPTTSSESFDEDEEITCVGESINDPLLQGNDAWYLNGMNVPCAWTLTHGDPSITVAVVDMYVDYSHSDLNGKIVSITNVTNSLNVNCGHGYASAGAVSAIPNNGICTAGSGYNTKVAYYIVGSCGGGSPRPGVLKAIADGHKIITVSLSSTGLTQSEVEEFVESGGTILHSGSGDFQPLASIPGYIYVAQADNTFSHFGPAADYGDQSPADIYALCLGVNRLAAMNSCGFGTGNTSFGTPTVAGVVALMKSVNACLSPFEIEQIIKEYHGPSVNNAPQSNWAFVLDAEQAVLGAMKGYDHNYYSNTTIIETPTTISGDLIVHGGATVRISTYLYLSKESNIIVKRGGKLILESGAYLTACQDKWKGIIVEGHFDHFNQALSAGVLELQAGASINNAHIGISSNPTHLPWPNDKYYGGLIKCDGGSIRQCDKGVEIMRYGVSGKTDKSYFNGTGFESCKNAASIWASNGVKFDDCTFTGNNEHCIMTLDSKVIVNGCTFIGGKYGIASESTLPSALGSEIGVTKGNAFIPSLNGEGIRATSNANITGLKIHNNNFYGGNLGTFINGASVFSVKWNDFVNQYNSVGLFATDLTRNVTDISENNISSSDYGSASNSANYTQYWDNCFGYNRNTDIFLGKSRIHPFQGIPASNFDCIGGRAANNCFSKGSTFDIVTSFPSSAPYFDYITKINENVLCKIPSNPIPGAQDANYLIKCSDGSFNGTCGSPSSTGVVNVQYATCTIPKTDAEYNQMVTWLEAQLAWLYSLTSPNNYQKYLLVTYTDCLRKIRKGKVIIEKENDEKNGTTGWLSRSITHLNSLPDFQSRMYAYGLMVEDGQYASARSWLSSLSRSTEEENDFYSIQSINLDYLENVGTYSLTNSDKNTLFALGNKTIPLNGFARSLYFALTGERIPIEIDYGGQNLQLRSSAALSSNWTVKSFPNPIATGFYNIEIVNSSEDDKFSVEITDTKGHIMQQSSDFSSKIVQVDVSSWPSGLYLYKIKSTTSNRIIVDKLIKL